VILDNAGIDPQAWDECVDKADNRFKEEMVSYIILQWDFNGFIFSIIFSLITATVMSLRC
jgi:hypothetical protein